MPTIFELKTGRNTLTRTTVGIKQEMNDLLLVQQMGELGATRADMLCRRPDAFVSKVTYYFHLC
jgi:hypothetical protein